MALALLFAAIAGAHAQDRVFVTGKVLGQDGAPMAGAMVAVYDDSNHVVDYARTDASGDYAMSVTPRTLHLDHHSPGFFTEVFGGIAHAVGGAAAFVANPLRAGVNAAGSAVAVADPLMRGGVAAGTVVADKLIWPSSAPRSKPLEDRKSPGSLVMKVVEPGTSDLLAVQRVYWVQQEVLKIRSREQRTLAAWLDPVQMMPIDSTKPSTLKTDYLTFKSAHLTPSIAQRGESVRLTAVMPLPPDPPVYVTVVARNNRTGDKWELKPEGDGKFSAIIPIDKRCPPDDQAISIIAYPANQVRPGRRPEVEKEIEAAGLWNRSKPYQYNPLLVVSRNRADVTLTVLKTAKK
jgi:hypothetical protein